jgi:hypothetical protein
MDIGVEPVIDALHELAEGHLIVLVPDADRIWMAHPFSGVATDFRVRSGEREWFANCIWDSFGILAAVGAEGTIHARCPDCAESIVVGSDSERSLVDDMLVHFAVPARSWWEDIGYT